MNDDEVKQLIDQAKKGDLKAVNSLITHVNELRWLVCELSDGLEEPSLQESVNSVMGPMFDIEDEDDD